MAISRRRALAAGLAALSVPNAPALAESLAPSDAFGDVPEFLPGAPLRTSFLRPGLEGERLTLYGRVLTTGGRPLVRARLDFWQTDHNGVYDAAGYKFRGAQYTDAAGRYFLETIMPAPYGPPRHIHFLLSAPRAGRPQPLLISSAIYFPAVDEFVHARPAERSRNFLAPDAVASVDGVRVACSDIVAEGV